MKTENFQVIREGSSESTGGRKDFEKHEPEVYDCSWSVRMVSVKVMS